MSQTPPELPNAVRAVREAALPLSLWARSRSGACATTTTCRRRRDAGRLERLVPVVVHVVAHDQASLHPHDLADGGIELDPAPSGAQVEATKDDDRVAGVDDLLRKRVHPLPGFAQVGGYLAQARVAVVGVAHAGGDNLVERLEPIVGRIAHEHQVEGPAYP